MIRLRFATELAFRGVRAKPTRTSLTLLGMAIGVAAVMLISSLGNSAQGLILDEIRGMGADIFTVQAGRETGGVNDITQTLLSTSLKEHDLEALRKKENVPHVRDASPIVPVTGTASYDSETVYPEIVGGNMEFFGSVFGLTPEKGVWFGEEEVRQKAFVAVIGSKVQEDLFGNNNPIGEKITIRGNKFRVVGTIPKKGQVGFVNFDDSIFIPYTTAQTYLLGIDHYMQIIVRVNAPEFVAQSAYDAEATMRETHRLETGDENDFKIRTPQALMDQVGTVLTIFTIFLTGVVAVALVVGGIGIMNIMLVSVTERTREIGLRKALGARDEDVLLQFLLEAVILTFLGGAVGVLSGALLAFGISVFIANTTALAWSFSFPFFAAFLALGSSVIIGIIFGLYPAYKASRKSPMEALRYE
jgi:ABC-type antimicrobial peptide transport system permease subunit